jgi:hypothetical protein
VAAADLEMGRSGMSRKSLMSVLIVRWGAYRIVRRPILEEGTFVVGQSVDQ